jgi:hypothetical protein
VQSIGDAAFRAFEFSLQAAQVFLRKVNFHAFHKLSIFVVVFLEDTHIIKEKRTPKPAMN